MSAMRAMLFWMLVCGLGGASICWSGDRRPPATRGRFSEVFLSVYAQDEARVGAVLVDRHGRRTGWTVEGEFNEIAGCSSGFGSEEGIPNLGAGDEDATAVAPAETTSIGASLDTVGARLEEAPKYHEFNIRNDAVTPLGLIDQGRCELRLDPVVAGRVKLALTATVVGASARQETMSVSVQPGVSSRWRLSWKSAGDTCIVRISRIAGRSPTRPTAGRATAR